jgi:hypothetical protein
MNKKPLAECELAYEDPDTHDYRLYVDIDKDDAMFSAVAVCYGELSYSGEDLKDCVWEEPGLWVQVVFEVEAYWDGVRHIHFTRRDSEMQGYLYYPSMRALVEMFQVIEKLEREVCQEVRR